MKKITLFLCIVFLATAYCGGQSLPVISDEQNLNAYQNPANPTWWNCDSTYYSSWNETALAWEIYQKEYGQLDGHGNSILRTYIVWNIITSQWENVTRYRNEYYEDNQPSSRTSELWNSNDNTWIDLYHTYYNADGKTTENQSMNFNTLTNLYTSGYKTTYVYSGLTTETVNQSLDVTTMTWVPVSRYITIYVNDIQYDEVIDQIWNSVTSEWVNQTKAEFLYNTDGSNLQTNHYTWDASTSSWQHYKEDDYTYNSLGWLISLVSYQWNTSTLGWDNYYRSLYQYDISGNGTLEAYDRWNSVTSAWDNESKIVKIYYPDNNMRERTTSYWNPLLGAWMETNYSKFDDAGYQIQYFNKSIDLSTFTITSGYQYFTTFENQRAIEQLGQVLNLITYAWEDNSKRTLTYDGNNNCSQEVNENYNTATSTWSNAFLQEHFYSDFIGIEEHSSTRDYCMFSNPVRSGQTINCDKLVGKTCMLNLVNMNGQIVYSTVLNGSVLMPSLAAGEYIMQIIPQGEKSVSGKILVVK